MSRHLIIRPEAETDITEAAVWYESREAGLGSEILVEIHAAIERALQDPLAHLPPAAPTGASRARSAVSLSHLLHRAA